MPIQPRLECEDVQTPMKDDVVSPARLVLTVHRLPQLVYSHDHDDIAEKIVESDDKNQYKRTPNKYDNHDFFWQICTDNVSVKQYWTVVNYTHFKFID